MIDEDFQKKVLRELKDIKTELVLIREEREILEDIITKVGVVDDKIVWHRQHIDNITKDLKADVKEGQISLENKVEEVKKEVKEGNQTTEEVKEILK